MSEVKGNSHSTKISRFGQPANSSMSQIAQTAPVKPPEKPLAAPAPPDIQFSSAVGSKNSRKIDPFAEQNAKRAQKKQAQAKRHKQIIIASSVIGGAAIVGVIVFAAIKILTPKTEEVSSETAEVIQDYNTIQNNAQKEFDSTGKSADEIKSYYETQINQAKTDTEKTAFYISEISSLAQNNYYDDAIVAAEAFEDNSFFQSVSQTQLSIYCGVMINIYSSLNDSEHMDHYLDLLQETDFKPDTEVIG